MGIEIEIGLLSYPGSQRAAVFGLEDLFIMADRIGGSMQATRLRATHWHMTDKGNAPTRADIDNGQTLDLPAMIILPPAIGEPVSADIASPYVAWLRELHSSGCILASICAGAFVLGQTGLLAGRTITTHWAYDEVYRKRFPGIKVDTNRLIIDDGDIITAGGVMAWVDLGLKLVERFLGTPVMAETARRLVVDPPGREQSFYSGFAPQLKHGDNAILRIQHLLQTSLEDDTSVPQLASSAGLGERTFLRRFAKATGLTPKDYMLKLRLAKAKDLLQHTDEAIARIAWTVGYADTSSFQKFFKRMVGLTPGDYRKRFQP